MEITQFAWDVVDSNSWLITEGRHGLLIDAVDSLPLYEALRPLETVTVILTHCHFDHICGLNTLRELRPDAVVVASEKCSENIGIKTRNMSSAAAVFLAYYQGGKRKDAHVEPFTCAPADRRFAGGAFPDWQGHRIRLIPAPGHSEDSLLILLDERILFSGDTLLSIPTATRFIGGSTKRFREETLPLLRSMKAERVYPGHGEAGKLADMLAVNDTGKE